MENRSKKSVLWIIVAIVQLNSAGMSVVFPLLPFLLGNYLPDSQVVVGMSALMSVFAACTFIAAPVFGALSDRYGRKWILIISLIGSAIGFVMFGIGGSLWILFLGRIVDGLTAGNISTLFAYVSDSTKPEERVKWFGYIGAAVGIGFMAGPALGGLLGTVSLSLPFYVTATLIAVSTLLVYFLLPESLSVEKRSKEISLKSLNTLSHFKEIFTLKDARRLLILGLFFYAAMGIYQFNISIYLKDVYKWGPSVIGSIITLVGACDIASRAVLLPMLLKRFSERSIGIGGLVLLSTGMGLIITSFFIPLAAIIVAAVIFITLGEGLFEPSFNGRLSQSVEEDSQGKLQGVNQSMQSLYRVLVPLAAAAIYFYNPWILYVISTAIALTALVVYIRHRPVLIFVRSNAKQEQA